MPENDLDCDLLRQIADEPAAGECGNKLARAYRLAPPEAGAKARLPHHFPARKEHEFDHFHRDSVELRSAIADHRHDA